ncbi:MAG: DNA polymerase III subunit alpha [Candidatus Riflebacteria bacterium]|nr:DNA polymerase III subunit alpha [Candidatus Riflebacteria bacterium]
MNTKYHEFVHLHVHSHYSLLDGAAPVKGIVDLAHKYNMSSVAITDHGNMFNAVEFYQYALKRGVKPIIGFEAYISAGSRFEKNRNIPLHHVVLLARNNEGYKNLVKLATKGYTEGFYYRPRIDHELLAEHSEGLIALGACLAGEVPAALLENDMDKAVAAIKRYQDILGKENFYVELQNHGMPEQIRILEPLVEAAKLAGAPICATNDSHYLLPEDWEAQDALLCLGTNAKLEDEKRYRFPSREFYFKTAQEMERLFEKWPEAIRNTRIISERCNVQLTLGKSILPHFDLPQGKTADSYLAELCHDGFVKRYGTRTPGEEIQKRLDYELSVIRDMGFSDYFLIVWDFIEAARRMDVPVGPGRGSAAGSIVAYLLGITDVDPLKYGLLFERFLNPERISMPDIDVDFSDEGRDKVVEYVKEKYGRDRVSQIITFNFMLAKMAIRDVGRVLGVDLAEVNRLAKLVPDKPGIHLKKCLQEVPELKDILANGTPEEKKLLDIASKVDGLARHTGVHACGVVISSVDLMDIVPLYVDKDKNIVSQYEKKAIESIGLLKMDFLGLKTLSIIKRALENIKQTTGKDIDLDNIPLDDKKTYELLQKAWTLGVFQLESDGMRKVVASLQPSVFEDIIALLAIYRPGPLNSGMVDDFIERKHGRKELAYPHPDLEPVLKDTYGVYLYQEQVMQTSNILAGFTMGQADSLRKAMGKKIPAAMQEMSKLFVEGAVKKGLTEENAQGIFDLMAGFAEYGFNKSHSAAYAVITYRTAYLKAYYPVEFMAAILSSELDNTDKLAKYTEECKTMKIEVLPPDINASGLYFGVENGAIRYALGALKGIGTGAAESIAKEREKNGPYLSFSDFIHRVDSSQVNARVMDALIKSGSFNCFNLRKSQLLLMSVDALKTAQQTQKERSKGQVTFFDLFGSEAKGMGSIEIKAPDVPELSEKELLMFEKEIFGFYFSNSPYKSIAPIGDAFATHSVSFLKENAVETSCRIAGILTSFKRHITKKGDAMAFLTLESDNASIEVTVFPRTYADCSAKLVVDEPIFAAVTTEVVDDTVKAIAEDIYSASDFENPDFVDVLFKIPSDKANRETYENLLPLLQKHPGALKVNMKICSGDENKKNVYIELPDRFRVKLSPVVVKSWQDICGKNSVQLAFPEIERKLETSRRRRNFKPKQREAA